MILQITNPLPLLADATIEPLVAWLKLSFQDNSISGMVLQYKGFDGLWKCLLNSKCILCVFIESIYWIYLT
jgi:hypothetical protein